MTDTSRSAPWDEIFIATLTVGLTVWGFWEWSRDPYYLGRTIFVCKLSGFAALGFLSLSLLIGPVSRVLGWLRITIVPRVTGRIARNTGIASALASIVHVIVVWSTYLDFDPWLALQPTYLQAGVLAFFLMLVLLIGSIKRLTTRIRWRLWKPLFRLSLAIAVLVLYHALYAPFASRRWIIGLYLAAISVWLLRYLPATRPADARSPSK